MMRTHKLPAALAVLALAFGFAGCTVDSDEHSHTFAEAWTSDAEYHWHAATCGHTTEVSGKAAHTFGEWSVVKPATETEDGTRRRSCSICAYEAEESYKYDGNVPDGGGVITNRV
ncbi:MAG: hypothetical protein K2H09_03480 [Treponemataceae bacterium]|nr:hypothetical protein [Treponemataceae bacterium]